APLPARPASGGRGPAGGGRGRAEEGRRPAGRRAAPPPHRGLEGAARTLLPPPRLGRRAARRPGAVTPGAPPPPAAEIRAAQEANFQRLLDLCFAAHPYYRRPWAERRVRPPAGPGLGALPGPALA